MRRMSAAVAGLLAAAAFSTPVSAQSDSPGRPSQGTLEAPVERTLSAGDKEQKSAPTRPSMPQPANPARDKPLAPRPPLGPQK
jgi:hypothetical protein